MKTGLLIMLFFCRLLNVAVLLLELTALSRGGTKFTAQDDMGGGPTERPAEAANALLNGQEA
jgi:hypothetical protein